MNHVDDEGATPAAPSGDGSDAALDAAFAAANAGMVAAIRRGFDLDAGLARIIGAPPRAEIRSPESSAESDWKQLLSFAPRPNSGWPRLDPYICAVDVGTQIARLRFRILELVRRSQVGGSTAVLLRAAASSLQDLHRGLEGRALSRQAAGNLLDAAGLALETASDAETSEIACQAKRAPSEDPDYPAHCTSAGNPLLSEKRASRKRPSRKRPSRRAGAALLALGAVLLLALAIALAPLDMSWLHGVLAAFARKRSDAEEAAVITVNVAILGLLMFRVPRRLFRLFRRRSERISAVTEAIRARAALRRQGADANKAAAVLRRSLQPGDCERSEALTYITLLRAVAKLQRPLPDAATSRIDVLREELDGLRPNVMKLFDGADDCSSCAPR
jgi:hypothetical protein